MNEEEANRALSLLESNDDLLRLARVSDIAPALQALLALEGVIEQRVQLYDWFSRWPRATTQLLARADDLQTATLLAPALVSWNSVPSSLRPLVDEILAVAYPSLEGPYREAAAERPLVQRVRALQPGRDYEPLPKVEPSWRRPHAELPAADTVEGVQARLNYLDYGCGPITGKWDRLTRRALARWQLHAGLEPTGELDEDTLRELRSV